MAGNPLASLPGLPQRPSLARSSASETRLTQPGIEGAQRRKLNSAPTAAFRLIDDEGRPCSRLAGFLPRRALNGIMDRVLQEKLHSRVWSSPMRQNHTINRVDVDKILGDV